MAKISIEVTKEDVKKYIADMLAAKYQIDINPDHIRLMVKSKQNYRDDRWEEGDLKFSWDGTL